MVLLFDISYIVFLSTKIVIDRVMHVKIRAMHSLLNIEDLKWLKLGRHSFSEFVSEHVAIVFGSKGCQFLIYG